MHKGRTVSRIMSLSLNPFSRVEFLRNRENGRILGFPPGAEELHFSTLPRENSKIWSRN